MLGDSEHALRDLNYSVATVSGASASMAGLPQDRPRTLFFGARSDTGVSAEQIAQHFETMVAAAGGVMHHVASFLKTTKAMPQAPCEQPSHIDPEFIDYCTELQKGMKAPRGPARCM